jgi:hypothetical protein
MTNTKPTLEQTARAAELAPRVAAIIGWSCYSEPNRFPSGVYICPDVAYRREPKLDPLDCRAFQQVLLALPFTVSYELEDALRLIWEDSPEWRITTFLQWLLTPAGMLAFYEALVALEGNDD